MWARIVEFMLAAWLSVSPFIFRYPDDRFFFWANDLVCSILIAFFSLICYYRPLRKMHLCNLLIAFWLIALGYIFRGDPLDVALQNYVTFGLLLLMVAIVPTDSEKPPMSWRDFYEKDEL